MLRISLTPTDIEAFLSVAETGSFSRCASLLGLSQPAVTARIQHLERVLGVPLFHRTTRRVVLTGAGERLRTRVGQTMEELRSLLLEFDDEANLRRGRVSIGASATVSAGFLGAAVTSFHARRPRVELVLFDDFYTRAADRLARGDVDLALMPFEPEDDMFSFEKLFSDPLVLAVAADHHLAAQRVVALSDLKRETFVSVPRSKAWDRFRSKLAANNLAVKPALQTRNPFAVISMIKAGFGVGFIPQMLTETLNLDGVVLLKVKAADLNRHIGIATLKGRAQSPATAAFIETLRQAALQRRE